MPKDRILVVDDEEDILELVRYNLEKNGYDVVCAATGEDAINEARRNPPGLVVLDLMLPGIDGLEVCKTLKNDPATATVPVLMLTARGDEADEVTGLELGAEDYVSKPFSPRVLLARVKAVLRRSARKPDPGDEDTMRVHGLVINPGRHEVQTDDGTIDLTYTEFRLLRLLAGRPGWVLSRDQIIDRVHGEDYAVTDRSVDVLIAGLRKKLGSQGTLIETVRGVGYRMKEE